MLTLRVTDDGDAMAASSAIVDTPNGVAVLRSASATRSWAMANPTRRAARPWPSTKALAGSARPPPSS